jgi:hypothetical protein
MALNIITPPLFAKSSLDSLPYQWNWQNWLSVDALGNVDTIESATITATPAGLGIGPVTIAGSTCTATIAGGTNLTAYTLTCAIVCASGQIAASQEVLNVLDDTR